MLPRKVFENVQALMAILVLFDYLSAKFCLKFFTLLLSAIAKYDAFCSHIFDYACLVRKVYCYQRGSKLWKNCIHQKRFRK